DATLDGPLLLRAISEHDDAIESLLARMHWSADPDDERAALLREILAAHPGERVIAFGQYAETVNVLRGKLAHTPGVAALTAAGARIASGRVSRDAVLSQFTPTTGNAAPLARAARIDLLLTTDLLSEGLNLQEASVVVHLDLPWNPARLEQRVGRVLRLGSRHPVVTVYSLSPPAAANRLLHLEQRLRDKLRVAERTVGVAGRILPLALAPAPTAANPSPGLAELRGTLTHELRGWLAPVATNDAAGELPLVAAAESTITGWLALVLHDGDARLVADVGEGASDSVATIVRAIELARGTELPLREAAAGAAVSAIERWLAQRRAASAIHLDAAAGSRARRAALTRVARALARVPRHRRSALAPLAAAARQAVTATLAEGAERILDTLVAADLPDEAWLRSVAAFAELNARGPADRGAGYGPGSIVAVVVFGPR
ncbi:MAG TPA: C-terminal helicase domain-containing protein, partial [Gemmatimonadaceae bacterium]|nr:C-terminal helicase domain-containing protein [Gemmatimonadaceae bacterium]